MRAPTGDRPQKGSPARLGIPAFVLVTILLAFAAPAQAAKPGYPITLGEHTRQVCDVLWLQKARQPNVWRNPRYRVRPEAVPGTRQCKYTLVDAKRTWLLKYRLGYTSDALKLHGRQFGGDLRLILLGKRLRPQDYQQRDIKRRVPPKRCTLKDRIVRLARNELGVAESWGSNYGPRISVYQRVTGAYRAAWCVSYVQWVYSQAGVGTFADRTAGVYYALSWAQRAPSSVARWRRTRQPDRGDIIIFHTWQGHMGLVDVVTPGGFYSYEGNANNAVLRRFHPWGARNVSFIHLPRADRKIKC